jgi:FAD/FMN-containing dehydrogenase
MPAPERTLPLAAFYPDATSGCAALEAVLGNGLMPAALEFLDSGTLAKTGAAFPGGLPPDAGFLILSEADGTADEATALRDDLTELLEYGALSIAHPDADELWRWRDGVSIAVAATRGGKVSEDIVVPIDRLAEAIAATVDIGARHDLDAVSWGHGGDGNLHSTFLLSRDDDDSVARAERAAVDLFATALAFGGSISGEHGLGTVKRGHAGWSTAVAGLHASIKQALDPKGRASSTRERSSEIAPP